MTACVSRKSAFCSGPIIRSIQCSPPASPRIDRPSPRSASRPSPRASLPNSVSWRSSRSARYGRSHGCASNSKAWVVSWRAIQVRNGPSGHAQRTCRAADVLLDEQQPARRGFRGQEGQVVLAQDAAAHEPEQEPELAGGDPAIGERHGRLGEAAAGRHDLVEQVLLELRHQRRERAGVGADPARPVDDARPLDDPRQGLPSAADRAGTIRAIASA